ncbi:MAG: Vms1/Ankzf1 family peptidyl-tRNA hydrolase [Acidimicrobiia bacterium]
MADDDLQDIYRADGTFVSVYLPTPSALTQAGQLLTTRWKNLRRTLAADGADDDTLAAIDRALDVDTEAVTAQAGRTPQDALASRDDSAEHGAGAGLAVIAVGGTVRLVEALASFEGEGAGRVGPLPWLAPLLSARRERVPYLVVLADRAGADIAGYGPDDEVDVTIDAVNQGPAIERVKPGGWSQRRYQQRAIEAWEENAREVAAEVADLADRVGARFIGLAGDVHATRLLEADLPARWAPLVRRLDTGTRAAGGDDQALEEELHRLVRTVVAEDQVALIRTYREELGQRDRAATGPARVVEALQTGMVEHLLLAAGPGGDRTAWFGPQPLELALDEATLRSMGVEDPRQAHFDDVAVRAALGSGASVDLVPATIVDGHVAAVLRAVLAPARPTTGSSPGGGAADA